MVKGGDLGGNAMVHVPGGRKEVTSDVVFVSGWVSECDQWRGV